MAEEKHHSVFKIVSVVATYWVVSISMVFANKQLVGGGLTAQSDVSVFVAWAQCLSTVFFCVLVVAIRKLVFRNSTGLPPLTKDIFLSKDFVFLSFIFTSMLTFNNLCLKFVGIAFFQVARSMTLIFTVFLSICLLKKLVSCRIFICCVIVALGFCLGVDQEKVAGTLSVKGVGFGLLTSVFVALNGIYVKKLLNKVEMDQALSVTFYMNIGSSCLLLPLVFASGQFTAVCYEKASDYTFFLLLASSGILSFGIGWASNMQIDVTSPVTHHISNNSKSVLQTILAVAVYSDHKSVLWWFSNLLVVFGAVSYTVVKLREDRQFAILPVVQETKS